MSTPRSENKDLLQANKSLTKHHKKRRVLPAFLFLVTSFVVVYIVAPFYFSHANHDSAVSEYVYRGRGIERFFWEDEAQLFGGVCNINNNDYACVCARGEWWTHVSGLEVLTENVQNARKKSNQNGTILYECIGSSEHIFGYYNWHDYDAETDDNFFDVYSNASESTFYVWAEVFILDGTSYTRSTEVPSEARWAAQVTWAWDSHEKTLEPLFSFHDLLRDEPSQGYRYINSLKTRISAEEFFAHSGASWDGLDTFAHELLYDRFLPMYFDSNPSSRYSIDNLGSITVLENTHTEAPNNFDPDQLGNNGV